MMRKRLIGWLRWLRERVDRAILFLEGPAVHTMGGQDE